MSRVINPDDYLETEAGRIFTSERNIEAWKRAYAELEAALAQATTETKLYMVMGVQAAGKSTWIAINDNRLGAHAIVFDAAVPARKHRTKLIELSRHFNVPAIAVWVQASLQDALARNLQRSPDKRVPEVAVRSLFSMLEPPTKEEGFEEIAVIT